MEERIKQTKDGTIIKVKIVANASSNKIEAEDEVFKIRIKAPAVDNKANTELVKFLSDYLKIAKSNIEITHGAKSSRKTILLKDYFGEIN